MKGNNIRNEAIVGFVRGIYVPKGLEGTANRVLEAVGRTEYRSVRKGDEGKTLRALIIKTKGNPPRSVLVDASESECDIVKVGSKFVHFHMHGADGVSVLSIGSPKLSVADGKGASDNA